MSVEMAVRAKGLGVIVANPFSVGTFRVWQRNRDVFMRLWKTEAWPPFAEALLTLLAFGFGLGSFVNRQVEGTSYLQFIAPGVLMTSVLFTASFECMFGTFIRMEIEKTFSAVIATPVGVDEVVSGEIVWAATRSMLTGTSVLLVLAVLGLTPSWWVLLMPVVAFVSAFMIASLAMIVTSRVSSFTSFNYFITLGVVPMQLFSGVFFPAAQLPDGIRWLVYLSPFYPAMQIARALFRGQITFDLLGYVVWVVALGLVFYTLAINLMHRRLIK